ncbi:hypothetical protein BH23GEM3_BH23GEM3_16750 [soil metagenome]
MVQNRSATLSLYVTEDGTVKKSHIHKTSGSFQTDRVFLRIVQTVQFQPANINGVPVPVWIVLPVSVTMKEEPTQPNFPS